MFQDFDDFHSRCCWVQDGVRCDGLPHAGGRGRSACELHAVNLRGPLLGPITTGEPTSIVPPPPPDGAVI